MHEPPAGLDVGGLLTVVQRSWDPSVEVLEHLAVGFGAHHWRGLVGGEPRYFVTVDDLGERHTLHSLRAAYAGAAALADLGLDFVVAPVEPFVGPFAGRAVSVTPWLNAKPVATIDRDTTATMLRRLHAIDPESIGVELPAWVPVVGPYLADRVAEQLRHPWSEGPYGPRSRHGIAARLDDLRRWTVRYAELGRAATARPWVPTHGEPGWHNQLITTCGTVLVDWETLKRAPAERDLRTLGAGDRSMLELFDLEWRLDEISQYATWFAGPHGDTADDRTAFAGLMHELTR